MKPFGDDLAQHHTGIMATTNMRIMLLAAARARSIEERVEAVNSMRNELLAYGDELDVIFANLEAAKANAPKVRAAAQNADDLAGMLRTLLGKQTMLDTGMDTDLIFGGPGTTALADQFGDFASAAREAMDGVEAVHARVARMRVENNTMCWQLLKLSWFIILSPLPVAAPPAPQQQGLSQWAQRVFAAMGPGTPILRPSQIQDRVKRQPGDVGPSVEVALRELNNAGKITMSEGGRGQIFEAWRNAP
jgi:hypothetical protein